MAEVESESKFPSAKLSRTNDVTTTVVDLEDPASLPLPKTAGNGKLHEKSAATTVAIARSAFKSGRTKSIEFRRKQLKSLLRMFDENSPAMEQALKQDLGRHKQEASCFDVEYSRNEVLRSLHNLDEWTKTEQPPKAIVNILDTIRIYNEPYGVVLVMSAWNYPFNLVFAPLVGAIAAGNCVVIKPSEVAEATEAIIADLLPQYLDKECYQLFLGGVSETTELLNQRFDYIFFTGSTTVGRIIHTAANKYLTPVTLELGGKCPVYVDDTADMDMTVRRVLWGKCSNAGQICIAPDYILCTKEIQEKFTSTAREVLKEFYGKDLQSSPHYARLISDKHYQRLINFLKDKNKIAIGGKGDASQRFIEPTILVNVSPNDPIMQEEIFGPILPIITIESPLEAVSFINAREKPLALYVFTKQKKIKEFFINNTSSGGILINDTLLHFTVDTLPFGGVGFSGMGGYHGKASFDTFTHKKGMLERNFSTLSEKSTAIRYPPFSDGKMNLLNLLLRPRKGIPSKWLTSFGIFCLGIVFIILVEVAYYHLTDKHLI